MSLISGLENATITSVIPKTGTDGKGRPVYGDNLITGNKQPIPCVVTAPTYTQQRTAQNESISVTTILTTGKLKVPIKVGDKLKCDWVDFSGDRELVVNKRETASNEPGLECVRLYVDYV